MEAAGTEFKPILTHRGGLKLGVVTHTQEYVEFKVKASIYSPFM